jgi:hypothetical protein
MRRGEREAGERGGEERVCDGGLLPLLVKLLSDSDPEVQANAAGTIMNTVIITKGTHTRTYLTH